MTLQDRLVKELRLRSISDLDAADTFAAEYIADYNRRFSMPAQSPHALTGLSCTRPTRSA